MYSTHKGDAWQTCCARTITTHQQLTKMKWLSSYFSSRLRDPSQMGTSLSGNGTGAEGNNRSLLEAKFNNVMTLCAMVPLLAFTCLNSVLHQRIPQKFRIMGSLAVILVVFLLTAILVKIEMAPLPFFTLTMIKIVIINCEFLRPF
ncbi:unnamed protein product [Oncorhynchus mykiss]|uniref:Uncharacterized protein n=1 Tax=Oncorhynchus mykiss TaxID=8022 RepID=A0A060YYE2_ONCMY|nr:unnamed protein product [Oncorhynchus mykiss]